MRSTKQYVQAPTRPAAGPVFRAAAGPVPKPAPPRPAPAPAPKPAVAVGPALAPVNQTGDYAAAVVVPAGKPPSSGRIVDVVAPGAAFTPPAGSELRGYLQRDGAAVQFDGAGAAYLDAAEAKSVFGTLVRSAMTLLGAYPAPPTKAVHRSAAGTPAGNAASAVQKATSAGGGRPLPPANRGKLEAAYGTDLGHVRVHTDSSADTAAQAVNAHAFATGSNIFFRSGNFRPDTPAGEKLLAHEVAHTVQQADGLARSADTSISEPGDRIEREAEAAAELAVRGKPASIRPGAGAGIARLADGPAPKAAAPPAPAKPPPAETAKTPAPKPAAGGGPAAPPPAGGPAPPAAEKKPEGAPPPATAKATAEPAGGGLAEVVGQVSAAGAEQKKHDPAEKKAAEAEAAVGVTADKAAGDGKAAQLGTMAGQKKGPFDRDVFKKNLRAKIDSLHAEDAKNIKDGDKAGGIAGAVQGEVAAGKQAAAGDIQAATAQAPTAGPEVKGPPIPAAEAGQAPAADGSKAVPAPVPDAAVSMAGEARAVDTQMASANVTPDQLRTANEPEFAAAAAARDDAHTQAEALPAQARAAEAKTLARAGTAAATATQAGLTGMHAARAGQLTAARDQQTVGADKHAELKKRVAAKFDTIYSTTKADVEKRLADLDAEVNKAFEDGTSSAKTAFYLFLVGEVAEYVLSRGLIFGVIGALAGDPEYKAIFDRGKKKFSDEMDKVIDAVATVVETGLNDVIGLIARGKAELDAAVTALPAEEQSVGREVAGGLQGQFADLEKQVEAKQTELVDSLAAKYVAAQKEVDAVVNAAKDPVGAVVQYAVDTVAGVLDTIRQMRDLLLGILAKAAEAVDLILADPIGFVANLAAGVKQGVMNFAKNIGTHLQKGLFEWLFGALAGAGIQIPDKFDLSGIMSIVLQVLGLTWTNIRKRAVAIVGEKVVSALETASEIIVTLVTKGPAGLWDYLKEKAAELMQTVIDGIKEFLIEKVVVAGVTWIVGLLNPASAFIKACKAIVDIIGWVMTNGAQIVAFVNAVVDSVLSIARGQIGVAAAAVENSLAKAVPVAIGFLAGLLGLGGLSEKIKAVIAKIQAPVNAAIDWLIRKAVQLAKAVGKMLGVGHEETDDPDYSPEKKAKLDAAFTMLDAELDRVETEGIEEEEAEAVADNVKRQHPVLSLLVLSGDSTYIDFDFAASKKKKKKDRKRRKKQLKINKKAGRDYEKEVKKGLEKKDDIVAEQVTIETPSGVRTRIDFISQANKGKIKLTEAKSSDTAPLTVNQEDAFPEIETAGGVIVGKGKPGFPGGTQIPPTKVKVKRKK